MRLGIIFLVVILEVCLGLPRGLAATEYVEGNVIVTFKPGANFETAKGTLRKRSLGFARHFELLSAKRKRQTGLVRDRTKTTAQLIVELKADPMVETAEPDYLRWVSVVPNDSRFAELWGLQNTGQSVNGTAGTASDDVKYLPARDLARPPLGEIVVGVLDTGVDTVHADLAANLWTNPLEVPLNGVDEDNNGYADDYHGYDFAGDDPSPLNPDIPDPDPTDSGYHGTHVSGTIAAVGDNMAGVIGVNDRVRILPLKVSDDGDLISTSAAISALEYATALKNRGVNIVALNASYGGGGFSSAEQAAIVAAGDAGIILCVSAGNESANNDTTLTYPASYRTANMINVAASDQNDALAGFSNFGATTVDLAAPGNNILSTEPSSISIQAGGTAYSAIAMTHSGPTTGVFGSIIDCGTGNSASEFPASVSGNIALIQRGTETFSTKVTNAMAAGATAAIIYNNVSGNINGTLGASADWIPTYQLTQSEGLAILADLPATGSILVTAKYRFLNGTSMAAPHVTGAVSFAAMNFPGDTVAQRRARILDNVDVKASLQGKVITNGRLNLLRIVDADDNGVADWQPVITTTSLPLAINGEAYSESLAVTGGSAPYSWSLDGGTLPAGITLGSSGDLSGTSSATGAYEFTAKVTDNFGVTDTKTLTLNTADSGPLDHFTWDYAPVSAYAGIPFAVRLTARDSGERVVTALNNVVDFSAAGSGGATNVTPASAPLAAGEFVGYLAIASVDNSVSLTATQGSASGQSNSFPVTSGTSTVNDGIPDSWKISFGLNPGDDLAAVDSDGDGWTDLEEFTAGTSPISVTSVLQISSTDSDFSTFFTVNFPGVAGKLYRISTSAGLGSWISLPPYVLPTTSGNQSVSVSLSGESQLFLRIEIVP